MVFGKNIGDETICVVGLGYVIIQLTARLIVSLKARKGMII